MPGCGAAGAGPVGAADVAGRVEDPTVVLDPLLVATFEPFHGAHMTAMMSTAITAATTIHVRELIPIPVFVVDVVSRSSRILILLEYPWHNEGI